jgi:hypothetical protein
MKTLSKLGGLAALLLSTTAMAQVVTRSPEAPPNQPTIDYQNAKPMPLPQANQPAPTGVDLLRNQINPSQVFGKPGATKGGAGSGQENPLDLAPSQVFPEDLGVVPEEFGTSGLPYSTSRVNAFRNITSKFYPYRAAGRVFFQIGTSNFVCSGSMIDPGIVVLAAHCVAQYGSNQFYHNWVFVPAYNNGRAPYGTFAAKQAWILTSYLNGSDPCAQSGVICRDDVALLVLFSNAGNTVGWYGYGFNGYSYNNSGEAEITELGYPVALDRGVLMERNDSRGDIVGSLSNNTVIGSLMTGGSSGGPWLVNFGQTPALNGTSFGSFPAHNIVVGVTSWGFINDAVKEQGASSFTSNNIVPLVNAACNGSPSSC